MCPCLRPTGDTRCSGRSKPGGGQPRAGHLWGSHPNPAQPRTPSDGCVCSSPSREPYLPLDQAGGELPHDGLHGVGAGPAAGGEQLHADGPAIQDVAVLQAGAKHPHEGRREGEVVGEGEVEQDVLRVGLLHVLPQHRVFVHLVQLHIPVEEALVHQLHRDEAVAEPRDVLQLLHQPPGPHLRAVLLPARGHQRRRPRPAPGAGAGAGPLRRLLAGAGLPARLPGLLPADSRARLLRGLLGRLRRLLVLVAPGAALAAAAAAAAPGGALRLRLVAAVLLVASAAERGALLAAAAVVVVLGVLRVPAVQPDQPDFPQQSGHVVRGSAIPAASEHRWGSSVVVINLKPGSAGVLLAGGRRSASPLVRGAERRQCRRGAGGCAAAAQTPPLPRAAAGSIAAAGLLPRTSRPRRRGHDPVKRKEEEGAGGGER